MKTRCSRFALAVLIVVSSTSAAWAQDSVRFKALLGLARSEREAGRTTQAVDLFRQADQVRRFTTKELEEFFWTAAAAEPRAANEVGRRLLALEPAHGDVRDTMIGIALRSHDEGLVIDLAEAGVRVSPGQALWQRRLGESRLRQRQPAEAAAAFARAMAMTGGTPADAAQAALSLEAAGSTRQAFDAWRRIEPDVWQSRAEWAASRMRAIAAIDPPLPAAKAVASKADDLSRPQVPAAQASAAPGRFDAVRLEEASAVVEPTVADSDRAADLDATAPAESGGPASENQQESLVRGSIAAIENLRRTGSEAVVLGELDRFEAQYGSDAAAILEVADRLAGYSTATDDPIQRRLIEWTNRFTAEPFARTALLTRARLFAAVGSWMNALDAIAAVLQASPTLPEALKLRAELLSYAGEYAASLAAYDAYLAIAPDDVAARRQQARVEGWRQAYGAARARYREIVRLFPDDHVIRAEADAKSAYYGEQWRRAITAYRGWLSLEPANAEGRFELAQAYQQAGDYTQAGRAYASLLTDAPPHRQAMDAYAIMRERRAPRASFSAETQSSNGYGSRRLLSRTDSLAQLSGSVGAGTWSVAAGPSRVADSARNAAGSRVGARIDAVAGPVWRAHVGLDAHRYSSLGSMFAGGDLSVSWLPTDRLRMSGGIERAALLDNLHTVEQTIAWAGPRAALSYRPTPDLHLDLSAAEGWLTDRNRRVDARVSVRQRLLRGRHEITVLAAADNLQYRETRAEYFSPAAFWKEQVGIVYRLWFRSLKYSGDREHWIEGTYLAGVDNRDIVYQSGNIGITHEFASGFSLVGSGTLTRSSVYTSSGLMLTFRLRPFSSGK